MIFLMPLNLIMITVGSIGVLCITRPSALVGRLHHWIRPAVFIFICATVTLTAVTVCLLRATVARERRFERRSSSSDRRWPVAESAALFRTRRWRLLYLHSDRRRRWSLRSRWRDWLWHRHGHGQHLWHTSSEERHIAKPSQARLLRRPAARGKPEPLRHAATASRPLPPPARG